MVKFKSPGIYEEEIIKVESIKSISDIAVFMGYTEKHQNSLGKKLFNIPTTVTSLSDFESNFGRAQKEEGLQIIDNSTRLLEKISIQFNGDQSLHNLYYSIQSFFNQGGKSCIIISVGTFKNIGKPLILSDYLLALEPLNNEPGNFLIAVPESQNLEENDFYILQENLLEFCKNNFGFAILDVPKTLKENFNAVISQYRNKLNSNSLSFGCVFLPNLTTDYSYNYDEAKIIIKKWRDEFPLFSLKSTNPILYKKYKKLLREVSVLIPPSGTIAGLMLKNDVEKGIWNAAANIKCLHIMKPEIEINTNQQEFLNGNIAEKNINCIRDFGDRGILVWGARTLDVITSEFKYIPNRRFVSLIQNDLKNALKKFASEQFSDTAITKVKIQTENYLMNYFKSGAFKGYKSSEAYFVKCGLGETMTQQDVDSGNLIVLVGIALLKPAEFIVFQIKGKCL